MSGRNLQESHTYRGYHIMSVPSDEQGTGFTYSGCLPEEEAKRQMTQICEEKGLPRESLCLWSCSDYEWKYCRILRQEAGWESERLGCSREWWEAKSGEKKK